MKLDIYMKSGNVIKIGGVKSWGFEYQGNTITGLNIKPYWIAFSRPKLAVSSINLSQIEAITRG